MNQKYTPIDEMQMKACKSHGACCGFFFSNVSKLRKGVSMSYYSECVYAGEVRYGHDADQWRDVAFVRSVDVDGSYDAWQGVGGTRFSVG